MYPNLTVNEELSIPLYSLVFLLGFVLSILIAMKDSKKYGIIKVDICLGSLFGGIGIIIGAKLLYFITKLPTIINNWEWFSELLRTDNTKAIEYAFGGLVYYGGFIGAVLGAYLYCKKYHINFISFIDIFAPLVPFVHAFGRIGCFLAGCCYGIEYHGIGSVTYPYNERIPELSKVPRVPVQLMEAFLNFIFSAVLYVLSRKKKLKPGQSMGIYLIYYTIVRYLLEMLRGDAIRGKVGFLSTSQIISIVLLPIGIYLICRKERCEKGDND